MSDDLSQERAALDEFLVVLREAGATKVAAHYSGSGDEGNIWQLDIEFPNEHTVASAELDSRAHDVMGDLIYSMVGDYGTGDGGEGVAELDVATGDFTQTHGWPETCYGRPMLLAADAVNVKIVRSPADDLDPYELRREAERLIGEDRISEDALREFVTTYGGEAKDGESASSLAQ